jgi:hypothetical protein
MAAKWMMTKADYLVGEHRPWKRVSVPDEEIIRRYKSGESENALAKAYGVNRWVIRLRLIETDTPIRGRHAAEKLKWSRMSAGKRKAQVAAAHKATRGRIPTEEERCKGAQTRQEHQAHVSQTEMELGAMLAARGIRAIPQLAIGRYNCDLGASPVAVEIFGGEWHWCGSHMRRTPERLRYILNAGWHVLMVKIEARRRPLTEATADYVAAYIKKMRRKPSARREYRVIRGAGELLAAGGVDDDEISIVSAFASGRDPANGRYKRVPR